MARMRRTPVTVCQATRDSTVIYVGTYVYHVQPEICINIHPDAVPPIHTESYHVATDKPPPTKDGNKFQSIFSDNLQPIATRGKKARSTLLVDQHCGNGCSIKRAPLSVSYYDEISGGHIGSSVVRTRCSAGPVLPLCVKHRNWRAVLGVF